MGELLSLMPCFGNTVTNGIEPRKGSAGASPSSAGTKVMRQLSPADRMPILFDGQTVIGKQLSSAALRTGSSIPHVTFLTGRGALPRR